MSTTETIEPRRPALGRAPAMSPSLRRVAHLDNPKKNPLARKQKVECRTENTIRVPGGNRIARRKPAYPTGSFLDKVRQAQNADELKAILTDLESSNASDRTYGRVLSAIRVRCEQLHVGCI